MSRKLVSSRRISMPPALLSSGRRVKATIWFTTSGKIVTRSRSQKLNTVSRCIAARDFGRPATMTFSTALFLNRFTASCAMAWRDERSPMPINTTPLPMGITSPPSRVALPCSLSGSPYQIWKSALVNSGWNL
ncbi:hypothetical protein D3C81_1687500 [compost metagenome]